MYSNYERLKVNRETVNNHIQKYRLFGNSFREMLISKRRYRTI